MPGPTPTRRVLARLFPTRRRRIAALAAMVGGVALLHSLRPTQDPGDHLLHVLFRGLYLVPIIAAAVWFELRGAVLVTGAVAGAYTLHVVLQWGGRPWENANQAGMLAVYVIVGLFGGALSSHEARGRRDRLREEHRLHREIVLQALAALSQALKWRDTPTQRHSEEVGRLAARIAESLGLGGDRVEVVRLAGAVHDIGKIGVADDVLLKPGSLSPEERRALEAHPDVAADILNSIPGTNEIAEVVRSHHEALDGSGYPRGLKGESIPLETRIVTAADIYSALTEERPYKQRMSREEALTLMRGMTGGRLDPRAFEALESVTGEGRRPGEGRREAEPPLRALPGVDLPSRGRETGARRIRRIPRGDVERPRPHSDPVRRGGFRRRKGP